MKHNVTIRIVVSCCEAATGSSATTQMDRDFVKYGIP